MCDTIQMTTGSEVETIREDGACLCNSTTREIMVWIAEHVPTLDMGERLEIEHTPFDWEVRIVRTI